MASGEKKPSKKKTTTKEPKAVEAAKVEAPESASLVQDMPPATFKDTSKCVHTYTSPRKVEDFGLD